MALHEITKEAQKKRMFKYKLSSFEQIFGELERLEKREVVIIKYLDRVLKLVKSNDPDMADAIFQVLQVMFDEISQQPDQSPGFHMIETMGVDFYETMRKELYEEYGE
jgi:hypothetical protein